MNCIAPWENGTEFTHTLVCGMNRKYDVSREFYTASWNNWKYISLFYNKMNT